MVGASSLWEGGHQVDEVPVEKGWSCCSASKRGLRRFLRGLVLR